MSIINLMYTICNVLDTKYGLYYSFESAVIDTKIKDFLK